MVEVKEYDHVAKSKYSAPGHILQEIVVKDVVRNTIFSQPVVEEKVWNLSQDCILLVWEERGFAPMTCLPHRQCTGCSASCLIMVRGYTLRCR